MLLLFGHIVTQIVQKFAQNKEKHTKKSLNKVKNRLARDLRLKKAKEKTAEKAILQEEVLI